MVSLSRTLFLELSMCLLSDRVSVSNSLFRSLDIFTKLRSLCLELSFSISLLSHGVSVSKSLSRSLDRPISLERILCLASSLLSLSNSLVGVEFATHGLSQIRFGVGPLFGAHDQILNYLYSDIYLLFHVGSPL
jgi:hypothetical protein